METKNGNTNDKNQETDNLEENLKKQQEKKDKKKEKKALKKAEEQKQKAAEEKAAKKKNKGKDTVKSEKKETVVETPPKKKEEGKTKVETPSAVPENKSETWKVVLLVLLVLIIGFLIWGASDDNIAGSTKNGNRLDNLETSVGVIQDRIGTFDKTDKETLSEKISVLNGNQQLLDADLISVRTAVLSNKKRSIINQKGLKTLSSKVKRLTSKVSTKDNRVKVLETIVTRLKTERCADWFNTGNSGINCSK